MAERPGILIIFSSRGGHTEEVARAMADGAKGAGNGNVDVIVKRARETGRADIEKASALAFGSPTYFSYMSGELKTLFDEALPYKNAFEGKPAIAFATGNGGQLKCIQSIEGILEFFHASFVQKSDILSAGLAVQGKPDEGALGQARAIGKKVGDAAVQFACGQGRKYITAT